MARLGVHEDEERVGLLGAGAHDVLQGGDVLERVQGHHAVVVVARQQEHGGILDPVALRDADVVERGVPGAVGAGRQARVKGKASTDATSPLQYYYIFLVLIICACVFFLSVVH